MAVFYANFIFTPAAALRMWLAEEICRHAAVLRRLEKRARQRRALSTI